MSVAVAQVKQIITIQGVDAASDAVNKANNSLKGLDAQARKTGAATAGMGATSSAALKTIQEKAGDTESALKGVKDFAGTIAPEISGIGDAFGGVEAVMRLLPGPMGLVAVGVTAAAAGAAALFAHMDKVAAKARLLTSTEGAQLAKNLNLGSDAAASLSAALADLGKDGIRPTDALLQEVAANARALGIEPAEAVAKFIAAWKEGPEAIAKVQREIGKVNATLATVPELARRLGLDPKALGLEATVSASDRLRKGLEDVAKLRANASAAEGRSASLYAQAAQATAARQVELRREAAAQQDIADGLRGQIASEELAAKFRAGKVAAEKSFGEVAKQTADIGARAAADAELAGDKATAHRIRLNALQESAETVQRELAKQQALVAAGTGKEASDRVRSLDLQLRQIAAQEKALLDADAADRKAKAREAADRARAAASAAIDAALRLRRAQADADGLQTQRERLALIDAEADKDRRAVQASTVAAKTKATLVAAIDQEAANKRRQLAEQLGAEESKLADENRKILETQAARAAAISAQLADTQTANARNAAASMADRLRELGDVDGAILVQRRQAHADYAVEVAKIDREIAASGEGLNAASAEFADLQLVREQRLLAAKQTLAEQQRRLDAETQARFREGIALSAEAIKGPAALIGRLGEENQKLAQGLNTAADAIANVSRQWKGLKQSAPDAISAAGAVASAFVEDERDKAAILAVTELAASIASYATQDYVGAAAHAASAALYAGVAGGVIGTGSKGASAGGAAAGPGGFAAPATQGGTQTATVQQQPAVIVNFNQPLVTKQEIGKAMNGALRSIGSTGYAKAKGV